MNLTRRQAVRDAGNGCRSKQSSARQHISYVGHVHIRRVCMRYLVSLLLAVTSVTVAASPAISPVIVKALGDPARPADSKAADALRKPAETLAFAGVKPGMIVGEFYPGGGYFTRMLSDVVGPSGHVYGIENVGWNGAVDADRAMLGEANRKNVSVDVQPFGTVNF